MAKVEGRPLNEPEPTLNKTAQMLVVVAGFFAVMEINTLTGPHVGTTDTYYAMFTGPDGVSGLRDGNPVRVAGVDVGIPHPGVFDGGHTPLR